MRFIKLPIFFISFLLISCGNEKKEKKESIKINKKEVAETSEDDVTNVLLTGNDQMRFNLKEIKVEEGDIVNLTLKHIGKLGVKVMGHNFVLLQKDVDINDFASAAIDAKDNNYIPKNSEKVIVHTKMIGGGEQTSIKFEAPEKGTYDFVCSFPGHVALMKGKFIVE